MSAGRCVSCANFKLWPPEHPQDIAPYVGYCDIASPEQNGQLSIRAPKFEAAALNESQGGTLLVLETYGCVEWRSR